MHDHHIAAPAHRLNSWIPCRRTRRWMLGTLLAAVAGVGPVAARNVSAKHDAPSQVPIGTPIALWDDVDVPDHWEHHEQLFNDALDAANPAVDDQP